MSSVELRGVNKSYGDAHIIKDCELKIVEGEFIVLVGPSGCGKSTLLRCIAGLEPISSGTLLMDGQDLTRADPVARGVAMVFQSYALYPHMTVAQNIGFGLKIAGQSEAAIKARVLEVATLLHLENMLERKPKALSGGQRQRVAIGRALARKPRIFLFDEPLSNLDASLRAEMRVELAKLHQALGNTMIYVTHDQVEAMTLATRMVVMNAGVIEQVGTPLELFNQPATRFVAAFLGQPPMNFIRVASPAGGAPSPASGAPAASAPLRLPGGAVLDLPSQANPASLDVAELGVRPEHLSRSDRPDALPLQVDVVEHLGSDTILYGKLPDGQSLTARLQGQAAVQPGQRLGLDVDVQRAVAFDARGRNLACVDI